MSSSWWFPILARLWEWLTRFLLSKGAGFDWMHATIELARMEVRRSDQNPRND